LTIVGGRGEKGFARGRKRQYQQEEEEEEEEEEELGCTIRHMADNSGSPIPLRQRCPQVVVLGAG